MQGFWIALWTGLWYGGLAVFSVLSVLVIIFGGFDLAALLASLRQRHLDQQQAEAAATPPLPGPPLAEG